VVVRKFKERVNLSHETFLSIAFQGKDRFELVSVNYSDTGANGFILQVNCRAGLGLVCIEQ